MWYEWEAFSRQRLECEFGLMFLSAVGILALYGPQSVFGALASLPSAHSPGLPPLQKYCELSGNPCLTATFPGDVETSSACALRVTRASAEQGYLRLY